MWQTSYKGFPVVTSSEDMAVVGYICMIFVYIYHTPRCGRHRTRASQS